MSGPPRESIWKRSTRFRQRGRHVDRVIDGVPIERCASDVREWSRRVEHVRGRPPLVRGKGRLGRVALTTTARGDLESHIERARLVAESNRLVGDSLTPAILQDRYIEKLSHQIQVMPVPSDGGGRILDPGSLTPTPTPTEVP